MIFAAFEAEHNTTGRNKVQRATKYAVIGMSTVLNGGRGGPLINKGLSADRPSECMFLYILRVPYLLKMVAPREAIYLDVGHVKFVDGGNYVLETYYSI